MSEVQTSSAASGNYVAFLVFDQDKHEYRLRWLPVVSWRVLPEEGIALPIAVGKPFRWPKSNEYFGLVAAPDGRFYKDGVYLSVVEWLRDCVASYEEEIGVKLGFDAWREVEPMPLPTPPAASVVFDASGAFDAEAFRPAPHRTKREQAPKRTASERTAADIFE